jgi:hypothetical protein
MKLTVAQKIMVAKDRAVDDLRDLVNAGYWNLSDNDKRIARKIATMIASPDDDKKTLAALKRGGYVSGNEGMFYDLDKSNQEQQAVELARNAKRVAQAVGRGVLK